MEQVALKVIQRSAYSTSGGKRRIKSQHVYERIGARAREREGGEREREKRVLYYDSGLGLHGLSHWCMSFMSLRLHTAWKIFPAVGALRHSECQF